MMDLFLTRPSENTDKCPILQIEKTESTERLSSSPKVTQPGNSRMRTRSQQPGSETKLLATSLDHPTDW